MAAAVAASLKLSGYSGYEGKCSMQAKRTCVTIRVSINPVVMMPVGGSSPQGQV